MKTKSFALAAFCNPRALLSLTICLVGLSLAVFALVTKAGPVGGMQSGPNFVVNTLADTDDGSCDLFGQGTGNKDCTLREAINAANAYGNAATITFSVSGTITLGSTLPAISNTSGLTIDSTGQSITVSGNNSVQVMVVNGGATLTVLNLTIADGNGGHGEGGGMNNSGTLNVINSTLSGHSAYYGGGIENSGTLTVTNSTFLQNSAAFNGGSIENEANKTVNVTNCTFSSNGAVDGNGGGIYNSGTLNVANSTFSGNSAAGSRGGGGGGGGIYNNSGSTTLKNTIIADNPVGGNCAGGVTADQYDLADDNTCGSATQKTSAQINLQSLGNNGGPTQTFALGSGSAAIDKGDPNFAPPPSTDQRGAPRVVNGRIDVGAYELQISQQSGPSFVVTRTDDTDTGMCAPGFCSLREAINAANAYNGAATITFNIPTTDPGYNSGVYTITLGSALPAITNTNGMITIDGTGQSVTVSGNDLVRVIVVNSGANLSLKYLTIGHGSSTSDNGGGIMNLGTLTVANSTFADNSANNNNFGGGISNEEGAMLTVSDSTFTGNIGGAGGAINNEGSATVTNTIFSGNSSGFGAAIYNPDGTLTVTNSTFCNNIGINDANGGAIFNGNTLNVANSTFSGNTAGYGGGIYSEGGTLTVTNSTFSGNSADVQGGGIDNDGNNGTLTVTNSTFSGNSASDGNGGGVFISDSTATLVNTIIANSPSGGDCSSNFGTLSADGSNLADDNTCGGAAVATAAQIKLQALANNGGPTDTMALGPGSMAINAGKDVTTLANNGGSISNGQTMFNVASATPFPAGVGFVIQIDSEQMIVIGVSGNQLTVTRHANSTLPASHNDGTAVNPAFDQRGLGYARKIGSSVDVGAFEAPAQTTVTTTAGGTVTLGSGNKLSDSATLSGGFNPTGTITFTLKDPNNTPVYTDVVTVSGNGNYTTATGNNPGGYLPTVAGTYTWSASYSGDNNNSASSDNGQNESETVLYIKATVQVSASPTAVRQGQNATLTITAAPSNHSSATVYFTMSGTAVNGTNYSLSPSSSSVNIPSGHSSATITLHSIQAGAKHKNVTATMTLNSNSSYTLGTSKQASVTISSGN